MKDLLDDAAVSTNPKETVSNKSKKLCGKSETIMVVLMFIITNIFLLWLWQIPLMKQGIGIKMISGFMGLILFFVIIMEFILIHKIIVFVLGGKSTIVFEKKHFVIFIIILFIILFILINLMTYSYGVNSLLCDKVEDKPVEDCDLMDFQLIYQEYKDLLTCENIYSAGRNKINKHKIISILKIKPASCWLGKILII